MERELLCQLHNAGFPLKSYPNWASTKDGPMAPKFLSPTLEELIEACGAEFSELKYFPNAEFESNQWGAIPLTKDVVGVGYSATEAVARLWLALRARVSGVRPSLKILHRAYSYMGERLATSRALTVGKDA